ncbi:retrovirus-related pol polyprotein from transposon TNT 1-94 [Tanacetum coccineum]
MFKPRGDCFGRSFLRMTKAIADFRAGTIIIYPDIDPFLEDTKEEEKSMDDWDHLLDFNLDDIPLLGGEELSSFVCKMGKSSRNKKREMENLNLFYQDIRTSSSAGGHLTQEEAAKEALAIKISQKFALLEEVRLVIETMAYHDKYKKVLDEIWKDKVKLDRKIMKEEEEAIKKVNENSLADTGSDINTMPYRIYEQLGREEMKKVDRGITMINHTQAEAMGILTNVLCQVGVTTLIAKFLILDIPIDRDAPIVVGRGFLRMIGGIVNTPERLFSTFDGFCHQTFRAARSDVMRNTESDNDDEEEPEMVAEDDALSKDKEIDKPMALISLSFKKIYKPTNNNLRTSSNTSKANQDNTPRINEGIGYDNQRVVNVAGARENVGLACKMVDGQLFEKLNIDDVDEVGDLGMYSIEDEEVSLVDGVLEGALGALEALEMEALVDAMDVDNGVIPTTSVSRPQLKSNRLEDRVMHNNSEGKKQQVEDHHLEVAFRKSTCYILNLKGNDLLIVEESKTGLHAHVRTIRTDKGTEFLNKTLHAYFAQEGIEHQTSTARTPEQNGVVERRNRTLVETARTMPSAAKVPLFFWAEAIATTCFTQNRSLVIPRHEKTPYHIINGRKPSVKFFHIFGSLCYIVRDGENLDKMKEKGDACIFVGYSTQSRAYKVYNKRTRVIVETIHVNFDELPHMASDHVTETVTTSNKLDFLFSPMFDELLNGTTIVVSKSSAVTTADAPNQRQQQNTTPSTSTTVAADTPPLNIHATPETTSQAPTQAPTVTAIENINQAETDKENAQVEEDEFINIFSTPVQERGETSSRYIDSSNMHTFYQRHHSEHRWTKDYSLE